jgi:hypothetical protein
MCVEMMRTLILAWPFFVTNVSGTGCVMAAPPATRPSNPEDPRAVLTGIIDGRDLRLSSDGDERAALKPFRFSLWLAPSQASRTEGGALHFCSDGAGASMTSRSKDGLPFCAARDDRYVQLDPDDPGGVLVCGGGLLSADVGGTDAGLNLNFRYAKNLSMPGIRLDLAPILRRVLQRSHDSKVDRKSGGLVFALPEHVVAVRLRAEADEAFPVRDVVFLTPEGKIVFSISEVHVDAKEVAQRVLPTVEGLKGAGFRVKEVPIETLPQRFPVPPAGFWSNEQNVASAKRLNGLLEPPQTQPTTRSDVR